MEVNVEALYQVSPFIESAIGKCQEATNALGSVQVPNEYVSATIDYVNAAIGALQRGQSGLNSVIENVTASEARNNQIVDQMLGSMANFSFSSSGGNISSNSANSGVIGGVNSNGSSGGNTTSSSANSGVIGGIDSTDQKPNNSKQDTLAVNHILNKLNIFQKFGKETAQKIINSILQDYSNGKLDILKMTEEELSSLIYGKAEEFLNKDIVKIMKEGQFDELMAKRINQVILDKKVDLANKTDEQFKEIINNISVTVKLENLNNDGTFQYFQGIDGTYGYKSKDLEKLFDYKNGEEVDVNKFFVIKEILEKTYGMTNTAEAAKFINDFKSTNMNEYTAVANSLLAKYKDNPEQFKKEFGVSLYAAKSENGEFTINKKVLLDIYVKVNNSNVGNINNTGQQKKLNMTSNEILKKYIEAKKIELNCTETIINDIGENENIETIKAKVGDALKAKQSVIIQLKNNNKSNINLINEETNKTIHSTNKWKENEINEAYVTECNDKGVVVSYKGERCLIKFSELKDSNSYSFKATNIEKISNKK